MTQPLTFVLTIAVASAAALAQQPVGQMIADEAGSPGQQDRAVGGERHGLTGSSR